mgnify:FL=1
MNIRDAAPVAAAIVFAGALGAGVIALTASGSPEPTSEPAPAVLTTQPAAGATRMAPRCFETSTAGAQDCAWVPVAQCLTDEDGDDAIPASYDGCYWDADARGNHEGASYVIWRQNRG